MKKLLFITPIFPSSDEEDTIVPFIYQFTKYYSEKIKDVNIDVLTLHHPVTKSSYKINKTTVYSLGVDFEKNNFITIAKACKKAYILNKKHNYDGILSFWYMKTVVIGQLLSFFLKTKHFCWLQGQDVKRSNKYFKVFKLKGSQLVTVGENHQKLLYKFQKIHTPNIANVAIIPEKFPQLNQNNREIDIIGVGNLGPIKNYTLFIDIIKEVKKLLPNRILNVIICGDGDFRENLQNKVNDFGLKDEVCFLGYTSNAKVLNFLNTSKIFLHTSIFEGNPTVLQEALYSGCKVVSTFDIRIDQKEVTNFYYGRDKESLSLKIRELILNPETTYQRVHQNNIDDTVEVIHKLFF